MRFKSQSRRLLAGLAGGVIGLLAALGAPAPVLAAETTEFRISRQPGILYLQVMLMEDKKLVEKHAALMGLNDVKMTWLTITSGGVSTDNLLAGSLDVVTSGLSNMLLVWGKTNGGVKAIGAVAGLPLVMVTRNPDVNTIKDFTDKDRIAVPTLKVSMQSTVLGIALEQLYGPGGNTKLDQIQVQIGHPEATQAVMNPSHEINSHFSISPYIEIVLKAPGVHAVLNSSDVLGGPAHITCSMAAQKFVDANPIKVKAYLAALDEASEMIAKDPKSAAETYLAMTKEKITADELVKIITQKGAIFNATPQRSLPYAEYMNKISIIKTKATSWKDYFFPAIHDRAGS